jgi:hypothetical protein
MKIINLAAEADASQKPRALPGFLDKLNLSQGDKEKRALETVVQRLSNLLDNRFTLLRNLPVGGQANPYLMTLVGPPGVLVLLVIAARGEFRVTEGNWETLESGGKDYKPARANLVGAALAAAGNLEQQLTGLEPNLPAPEAALLFTDPGAHVNTVRPKVRAIPSDGLDRFAVNLTKAREALGPELLRQVVDRLTRQVIDSKAPVADDAAWAHLEGRSLGEAEPQTPSWLSTVGSQEPEVVKKIAKNANFTRRQWLILAGLLAVTILILLSGILFAIIAGS